jgi:hypothetical protein
VTERTVTIVDGDRSAEVPGITEGDAILVALDALESATGWELRAEGLCRGDVCIPRRDDDGLVVDGHVDLASFAAAVQRPLAFDNDARVAVLAESPEEQAAAIAGRVAPEFTLPDLDDNLVSSSAFAGKKKLYVAWASW